MTNLSSLTPSGWGLLALTLALWCGFVVDCIDHAQQYPTTPRRSAWLHRAAGCTAWLLWLVTP